MLTTHLGNQQVGVRAVWRKAAAFGNNLTTACVKSLISMPTGRHVCFLQCLSWMATHARSAQHARM